MAHAKSKPKIEPELKPLPFTGVARSMVCVNHQNKYRDMKIVTLHIKDGIVEKIDYSDHYAAFEAGQWFNHAADLSILHLNNKWEDGKTMETHPDIYWENRESK